MDQKERTTKKIDPAREKELQAMSTVQLAERLNAGLIQLDLHAALQKKTQKKKRRKQ